MIQLPSDNRRSFICISAITGLIILGMLYFGIQLKGFRPQNNVHWLSSGTGLVFDRSAVAYTNSFFPSTASSADGHLTIVLAITPQPPKYHYFKFLLLVHDGEDERQLVVGQWRNSLVIMNGDDYSNRERTPKIYLPLTMNKKSSQLVTIVSAAAGTRVFLDGLLKKENKKLILRYPRHTAQAHMVIGNSLAGNNSWDGKIMGMALYDRDLDNAVVQRHYRTWRSLSNFKPFKSESPRLLYTFDEGKGNLVHNHMGKELNLIVPTWMKALRKEALAWPPTDGSNRHGLIQDYMVNLFGFVPLGFFLLATLVRFKGARYIGSMQITALFAFGFSLSIEWVQVWIPSRDSSMLDFLLNNLGCWIGISLFHVKRILLGR